MFDMDGVLIDAKEWHYEALNMALEECGYDKISLQDHLLFFDGLSTKQKMERLIQNEKIKPEDSNKIETLKQKYTIQIGLEKIKPLPQHIETMEKLKKDGYKLCCCSNSIRNTVQMYLEKAELLQYFDFFLSNQDVENKKPSPDIYIKAIEKFNAKPDECLICEDNINGIKSALGSGGNLLKIDTIFDVNYQNIKNKINHIEGNYSVNIVIPMAGAGSRFVKEGYMDPKPFIDVNGKTMIENVIENLQYPNARYILIAQKKHLEQQKYQKIASNIKSRYNAEFVLVDKLTEGAVCTVLHSRKLIDNDKPMVIANSDQIIDINFSDFVDNCINKRLDGEIMTFIDEEKNPKWSFARVDGNGFVKEVREKVVISQYATSGIYMWNKGSDFVNSSIDMIARNERVNNEFYVCPTYNYLIENGAKIGIYNIEQKQMHGTGTPEDLKKYIELVKHK